MEESTTKENKREATKRKSHYNPEADKRWNAKNPERRNCLSLRSSARSFIRNKATAEDLEELEGLIADRREKL